MSLTASINEHVLVTNFRDFLAGHDLSMPPNTLAVNELQLGAKVAFARLRSVTHEKEEINETTMGPGKNEVKKAG